MSDIFYSRWAEFRRIAFGEGEESTDAKLDCVRTAFYSGACAIISMERLNLSPEQRQGILAELSDYLGERGPIH